MDRKIPKNVLQKEKRNKLLKVSAIVVVSVVAIIVIISLLRDSISLKNVRSGTLVAFSLLLGTLAKFDLFKRQTLIPRSCKPAMRQFNAA